MVFFKNHFFLLIVCYGLYIIFGLVIAFTHYTTYSPRVPEKLWLTFIKRSGGVDDDKLICLKDADCNNGKCKFDNEIFTNNNKTICECNKNYIEHGNSGPCGYKQKDKLTTFLLSLFVGIFGVDWFYLSKGDGVYIFAGIMKLITIGGCGIWSVVDWIRVLVDAFPDGNGVLPGHW